MKKFMCKDGFFFNLTSPYHTFVTGEYYEFNVNNREGINVYSSIDCDYITVEDKFKELFISTDEIRDIKINKILN